MMNNGNLSGEIDNYLKLHELISKGINRFRDEFAVVGIGKPLFPVSHALILEKENITDCEIKIKSLHSIRDDMPEGGYGKADMAFSKKDIPWNGDIDKVISLIENYKTNNTVILVVGPGRLEEKIESITDKFLAGLIFE